MRISSILEELSKGGRGSVVIDEKFTLWTSPSNFDDKASFRELKIFFPSLRLVQEGLLIRLGNYFSLGVANRKLAETRKKVISQAIRQLFLLPPKKKTNPPPKKHFLKVRQTRGKVVIF